MTKHSIVAIHQPNFFPWLGFFDKIALADTFIFLDDVIYSASAGMYPRRTQILVNNQKQWIAAPLLSPKEANQRNIAELQIREFNSFEGNFKEKIENYSGHPHFPEVIEFLDSLFKAEFTHLADFNINAIKSLVEKIDLPVTNFLRSSDLNIETSGTQRLVDLCRAASGDCYLSGRGSSSYLQLEVFDKSKLKIVFQPKSSYTYIQQIDKEFIPGLSIIDALMNVGFKELSNIFNRKLNLDA